jgi:hypothetical protein
MGLSITALRGIGSMPRYELVRPFRERRRRFSLTEEGAARADVQWADEEKPGSVQDKKVLDVERTGVSPAPNRLPPPTVSRPQPSPEPTEDLAQLSVDEVVRRLIPDTPELARVTGLAPTADGVARTPHLVPLPPRPH